jgi:hypothetical protein
MESETVSLGLTAAASIASEAGLTVDDRGANEQLLQGEPHTGNLLKTFDGMRFIDLETCCHGPVEFDVAHAPIEVGRRYAVADRIQLRDCRILVLR